MKFTTASAAIAVAATGAAAQDGWSAWASASSSASSSKTTTTSSKPADPTKSCPATITSYKTESTTVWASTSNVYKATVTVPIPDKPANVDIKPDWVDWDAAKATETVTTAPVTCTNGKTVTSTTTLTSTRPGTTTITQDILFLAAQATGSAEEAWDNWNPNKGNSNGGSGSGNGNGNGNGNGGSGNGNGNGNGNGWGGNGGSGSNNGGSGNNGGNGWSGNGNGGSGNGGSNGNGWNGNGAGNGNGNNGNGNGNGWSGNGNGNSNNGNGGNNGWNQGGFTDDGTNSNDGWGQGSWGGKGNGGQQLGSGKDVFKWNPPVVSLTKSGSAPQYTKKPDGNYGGAPWGEGDGSWGDWNGGSGSGSGDGSSGSSGSGSNGGSGIGGNGGKNGTTGGNSGNGNGNGNGNSTIGGNTGTNSTTGGDDGGNSTTCPDFPAYGSLASNLTAVQKPLAEPQCNDASDRSKWCDNKDTSSDYYQDYFTKNRCTYDLVITNGTWNHDGEDVMSFLINGQFPGPAIECNWGDMVIINVHNQLTDNGTTIHWHGVRQTGSNDQDGVPGVTECAIAPGKSRTYVWRASSYGTSWYHSHWGLQYGDGIQGPIIIHGPATADYDVDAGPVMISDTFGMTATQFGSLIAHIGPKGTDNYLLNGKNTKFDLSSGQHSLWKVKQGKKYLFRFINSASQNMYSISIDQHKLKVIAADFVPLVPYETEWLNIGIGQRYDVVVEMNQDVGSYFLRAVTQTLCPAASINSGLGAANGIIAYEGVSECPLLLPNSTINGGKTADDFNTCIDEPLASLVPFVKKSAGTVSSFQSTVSDISAGSVSLVQTADDGAVFRWLLNNGAMYINYTQPTLASLDQGVSLNESLYSNPIILKQQNQWVYFVIQNQFSAFHPLHLHGHDFSVLGQGDGQFTDDKVSTLQFDNPIRRDTAMLQGASVEGSNDGGYTVIGFETDNPGAWLMHCHIAWHVDQGLALQWIERPDDMKSSGFISGLQFKQECDDYAAYEGQSSFFHKFSGQSGLRKRNAYFDSMFDATRTSVVRRDDGAHHYLAGHMKRNVGDGTNRRTFGRRR